MNIAIAPSGRMKVFRPLVYLFALAIGLVTQPLGHAQSAAAALALALTPYQSTVNETPAQVSCGDYGICTVTFAKVPAHQRLNVFYVSMRYTSYSVILDAALTNGLTGEAARQIALPGGVVIPIGSGISTSQYSGQVLFYVDGGDTPTITFYGLGILYGNPTIATLVGVLSPE